jgi:oligoendopeptidase F
MIVQGTFIKPDFEFQAWSDLLTLFEQLESDHIDDVNALAEWIAKRDELDNFLSENMAWRYIRMTCDTADESARDAYLFFVNKIQPELAVWSDRLNQKLIQSSACPQLEKDPAYFIYLRSVRKSVEMFREENIPIETELQNLSQQYSQIQGNMSVEWEGEEKTLQQMALLLKDTDRNLRKRAYDKIAERRLQDVDQLNQLFSKMISLRHQLALNAGYANYADYMFDARGRFDYRMEDCFSFHRAVEQKVVPLFRELMQDRRDHMQLADLRPWDTDVHPMGKQPLKPFTNGEELLEKGIACLNHIDPYFGQCLSTMQEMGHLDLESRKGKSPGGYNYPLMQTGVPFIFMNAAGSLRDVETLVHEAGHAVHSFLAQDLPLGIFRNTPSEVAELASMSMELISMEGWKEYFHLEEDLKRAQREQLEGILSTLPWIATVDAFQHWIYRNPDHTTEERVAYWNELGERFGSGLVNWQGYEEVFNASWQRQLHIFELPFYYIEYGFAQLGAIGVWKNYLANTKEGLEQYKGALAMGYTRSIPELYEAAGVRFAFDPQSVDLLMQLVKEYIAQLNT